MKNKTIIKKIILIIAFILILFYIIYDFTPLIKTPLANAKFGNENCTQYSENTNENYFLGDNKHPSIGLTVMTPWKCTLCWRFGEHGSSITPSLCDLCAKLTNRCSQCRGLLEN